MGNVLLVGIGGFIGSVARYALGGAIQSLTGSGRFPFGTMFVNLLGCLVIGVLSEFAESRGAFSGSTRAFFFVGILGGFTTFSAFGSETMIALRIGNTGLAVCNVVAQVGGGLICVWLGRAIACALWK
jgi:CrcB protein